jgi:tetratricopeptide (TPR) repeat protein
VKIRDAAAGRRIASSAGFKSDMAHSHFRRGVEFAASRRIADSNAAFAQAESYGVRNPIAYLERARALMDADELDPAADELAKIEDAIEGTTERAVMATTLGDLGELFLRKERLVEAAKCLEEAIAILEELAKADLDGTWDPHYKVSHCAYWLALTYFFLGGSADWESAIDKSMQAAYRIQGQYNRTLAFANISQFCGDRGRWSKAETAGREALAILAVRTQRGPVSPTLTKFTDYFRWHVLNALWHQGKREEHRAMLQEIIELVNTPRNKPADHALNYNFLAWILCTFPDEQVRNPPEALKWARKAVEAQRDGATLSTLGVALYRNGLYREAIDALNQSIELKSDGADTCFFLAMAHWQLGEKDEARTWFIRAIEWMEKNAPQDEELQRFRAEAEALITPAASVATSAAEKMSSAP